MKSILMIFCALVYAPNLFAEHGLQVGLTDLVSGSNVKKLDFKSTDADFDSDDESPGMGLAVSYLWGGGNLEYNIGVAYSFSKEIQSNNSAPATWNGGIKIKDQTFNQFGSRFTTGYRFYFGDFGVVPYGGLGVFFGSNKATLTSSSFTGNNEVTLAKGYVPIYLGSQARYKVTENFAPYLNVELVPFAMELASGVDQEGPWSYTSQVDSEFEDNLDFGDGFTYSVHLGVSWFF